MALVFSTALLAFAFVFGQTAATMFRALIMIFVVNPFGGDSGALRRPCGGEDPGARPPCDRRDALGRSSSSPSSLRLDARIYNLSWSPSLWMNVTFDLDVGVVTAADVERLRESLAAHVDSDAVNHCKGSVEVVLPGGSTAEGAAAEHLLPARVQSQRVLEANSPTRGSCWRCKRR